MMSRVLPIKPRRIDTQELDMDVVTLRRGAAALLTGATFGVLATGLLNYLSAL